MGARKAGLEERGGLHGVFVTVLCDKVQHAGTMVPNAALLTSLCPVLFVAGSPRPLWWCYSRCDIVCTRGAMCECESPMPYNGNRDGDQPATHS